VRDGVEDYEDGTRIVDGAVVLHESEKQKVKMSRLRGAL